MTTATETITITAQDVETEAPTPKAETITLGVTAPENLVELAGGTHAKDIRTALFNGDILAFNGFTIQRVADAFHIRIEAADHKSEVGAILLDDSDDIEIELSRKVESSRFTKGANYGMVLAVASAMIKASAQVHPYRDIVIGITEKRAIEAANLLEEEALTIGLPYTQSYETIALQVARSLVGGRDDMITVALLSALVPHFTLTEKPLPKLGGRVYNVRTPSKEVYVLPDA